jgi:hypothetical protein
LLPELMPLASSTLSTLMQQCQTNNLP